MSDSPDWPDTPTPLTLGQRIDAVLQPLYDEADAHRATLDRVQIEIAALNEKAENATAGLVQIESRMAEVVRSMAQKEPVIAAVLGDGVASSMPDAPPAEPTPAEPATPAEPTPVEPASELQTQEVAPAAEPAPVAESAEPEQPAEAEAEAEPEAEDKSEPVALDLAPEVDQAMVDEAASLLAGSAADAAQADAAPVTAEALAESAPSAAPAPAAAAAPPASITAAAERAAEAARQLREKSGVK